MSTLIRIPSGYMRFVPANKQTDDESTELKPAKWPVELILIANDLGREAYLDETRIRNILSPAIVRTCRLKPEDINLFPPLLQPRHSTSYRTRAFPKHPLPHRPATSYTTTCLGPQTPPPGMSNGPLPPGRSFRHNPGSFLLQGHTAKRVLILANATRTQQRPTPNRDGHHPPSHSRRLSTSPIPMDT